MLRDSIESDTAEEKTGEAVYKFETGERRRGKVESCEDLGEGERIVENDQTSSIKPSVEGNEIVEAAAMDNRNFMEVIIGGETYVALLDPGATISLVRPRLAKRFEQRLEETSSHVKGVTGSPVRIKGVLKINLDVGGCNGQLTCSRAVEDIGHEIVLGMDFGRSRNCGHTWKAINPRRLRIIAP